MEGVGRLFQKHASANTEFLSMAEALILPLVYNSSLSKHHQMYTINSHPILSVGISSPLQQ